MKSNSDSYISDSFDIEIGHLPLMHDDKDTAISKGVSAMFTGIIGNQLIVAGGCNFPHIPVSQGGTKQFYNTIYSFPLDSIETGEWKNCGKLPLPLAYGACVTCDKGLLCIGGMNQNGAQTDVLMLMPSDQEIKIQRYPSLPKAMDNMYATILNNKVYLGGGNANGSPSFELYMLDLGNLYHGWRSIAYLPDGPRIQPVLVGAQGKIFLWGGFCPANVCKEPAFKPEGYSFDPETRKWTVVCTPTVQYMNEKKIVFLTGGVGAAIKDSFIVCAGGVNLEIFQNAIRGKYNQAEYLSQPKEWYRFNRELMLYDTHLDKWFLLGNFEGLARAGAGIAVSDDSSSIYIVQGEEKPGIRTPQVCKLTINDDFR